MPLFDVIVIFLVQDQPASVGRVSRAHSLVRAPAIISEVKSLTSIYLFLLLSCTQAQDSAENHVEDQDTGSVSSAPLATWPLGELICDLHDCSVLKSPIR